MLASDVELKQNGTVISARVLTNAQPLDVVINDANGDQLTGFNPSRPGVGTITSVAASVTDVTLLAANAARRQFMIYNDSIRVLKVALDGVASATNFSFAIGAGGFYESEENGYTGVIHGIWNIANGDARITEITP